MGYQVCLPPRYVVKLSPQHTVLERSYSPQPHRNQSPHKRSTKTTTKKKVRFDDERNNKVIRVSRIPEDSKQTIWYDEWDYMSFRVQFWSPDSDGLMNQNSFLAFIQTTAASMWYSNTAAASRSIIPDDDKMIKQQKKLTFGPHARESRHTLVDTIMRHQQDCRSMGYCDPQGLYLISKALSKSDRKLAWELALFNAEEVALFNSLDAEKEFQRAAQVASSSSSVLTVAVDYYLDSIHPMLNDPLEVVSSLLCKIDD